LNSRKQRLRVLVSDSYQELTKRERWTALLRYIVEKIIATKPRNYVQPTLMP
jgi:hypothetical protein